MLLVPEPGFSLVSWAKVLHVWMDEQWVKLSWLAQAGGKIFAGGFIGAHIF